MSRGPSPDWTDVPGTIDSYDFVISDVFGVAAVIMALAIVAMARRGLLASNDAWTTDAARCLWKRHQPLNQMQTTTAAL